ncbi:MAG: hypothetical protein JWQ42_2422 [Edaphobacter sp.]|nr:hypothetical protein [Edaphobacter sp.]
MFGFCNNRMGPKHQFATDRFAKPLPVSSCLDVLKVSQVQSQSSKCCLLLMSFPPGLTQKITNDRLRLTARTVQGFVFLC